MTKPDALDNFVYGYMASDTWHQTWHQTYGIKHMASDIW